MANELIEINNKKILIAYDDKGIDPYIKQAKELVENFDYDLSTGVSRAKIASLASKVSKFKIKLDDVGKELVSEWKSRSKLVDKSRKKMRDELDDLRDLARKPLTDWEENQKVIADEKLLKAEAEKTAKELEISHEIALLLNEKHDREILEAKQKSEEEDKRLAEQQKTDQIAREQKLKEEAAEEAKIKAEQDAQAEINRINKERQEAIDRENQANIDAEAAKKAKENAEWLVYISEAYVINNALIAEYEAEKLRLNNQWLSYLTDAHNENNIFNAEIKRINDIELAKQAEIKRQNDDKVRIKRETEAREANENYRRGVHQDILSVLVANNFSENNGKSFIKLLAKGLLPKAQINY